MLTIKKEKKMEKITKSFIKLSEIPPVFKTHETLIKLEIFHFKELQRLGLIDDEDNGKDEFRKWLIQTYPTIKQKISFLIYIDENLEE